MTSSDIADAVGVPRNLMSSHLAVLSKARAIASTKNGRSVTYKALGSGVVALGEHLRDIGARAVSSQPRQKIDIWDETVRRAL